MSYNRYAKKPDATQEAIISALRDAGCQVYVIGRPCDLLVRYWSNSRREHRWQTIECKTPYGKSQKEKLDKRQKAQIEFLQETGTPIALTPQQALKVVEAA